MDGTELILWTRLLALPLDDPDAEVTFTDRLAAENDWTHEYAERVVFEYRCFLLLCMTSDEGVTPSEDVDHAWHLHLLYTRSSWNDLCRDTLGRPLHHTPTLGGY